MGVDLTTRDTANLACLDILVDGSQGLLYIVGIGILPCRLKLGYGTLRAQCLQARVDAFTDAFLGAPGLVVAAEAALDVDDNASGVLWVTLEIAPQQSGRVAVWRTVELAAVEVVATRIKSGADSGERLVIRDSAGSETW